MFKKLNSIASSSHVSRARSPISEAARTKLTSEMFDTSAPNINDSPVRYVYVSTKESLVSDELGAYISYGISALSNGQEVSFISDVSTDPEVALRFARVCTECQLDPIHLPDVIEDLLADVV